ncbi:hypothetical protein DL764_004738 [Monosporascus ibericus]|uniref:Uncharacterized protein n=1 Tax=Monosporascus ibericus TaxID=155417 RepID=A0A4Q4TED3_9PEZI|nr:hypothetical protein DL764_004738 [Monosporascus ibericus]
MPAAVIRPPKTGGGSSDIGSSPPPTGLIGGSLDSPDQPPGIICSNLSTCPDPDDNPNPGNKDGTDKDKDEGVPESPDFGSGETTTTATAFPQPTVTGRIDAESTLDGSSASTSTPVAASTPGSTTGWLPAWAIVLIIVGAVMMLVFAVSLGVFCVRERRKKYERGKDRSYGRAVRRALAAATGAFIPIWIVGHLRRERASSKQGGQDAAYAKTLALLEHEEQQSQASLSYAPSAPSPAPAPAPAPTPAPSRRPSSVVSALSSRSSGRGRYERVETGQRGAAEVFPGTSSLQRNLSLVSALSSTDGGGNHSAFGKTEPPSPMSGSAPTFATTQSGPIARARNDIATGDPAAAGYGV